MNEVARYCSLLVLVLAVRAAADNWPEYMHDSQRNAQTAETLKTPLHLQWVHTPAQKPSPAWPLSARVDYYHGKRLRLLVTYDQVFEVIAAEGKVYYGSSADDGLHCLDAAERTGQPYLWLQACIDLRASLLGDHGRKPAIPEVLGLFVTMRAQIEKLAKDHPRFSESIEASCKRIDQHADGSQRSTQFV